jgi:hypothetical protein
VCVALLNAIVIGRFMSSSNLVQGFFIKRIRKTLLFRPGGETLKNGDCPTFRDGQRVDGKEGQLMFALESAEGNIRINPTENNDSGTV